MKLKPRKLTPTKAARIRKEIAALEAEKELMARISALRDLPDGMLDAIQNMANTAQLPVEMFAPNYAAFQTVNLRMRITLLEAQLAGDRLN